MLENLFSFSGRLQRLPYLGLSLLVSVGGGIAFSVLIGSAFALSARKSVVGGFVGAGLVGLLVLVPLLWSTFALTTKRLRDAGFPPFLCFVGLVAFALFDHLVLARKLGMPAQMAFAKGSIAGAIVQLAFTLILMLWPSAEDEPEWLDASFRSSVRPEPEPIIAAPAPMPSIEAAAPAMAVPSASPSSFGRRRRG